MCAFTSRRAFSPARFFWRWTRGRERPSRVRSKREIPTDYAGELIAMAHGDFLPRDPESLNLDAANSTAADPRFRVYAVKGK